MENNQQNSEEITEFTYWASDDPYDEIELSESIIESFVKFITPIIKDFYADSKNTN